EDIRSYMNANGIVFKMLFKSEFALMVPANHRLINKEQISYKDITNEPIMLYRNGLIQSTMIQLLGKKYKENIILSFVDYISIINLVRDGVGVSIIPKSYISTLNEEQKKGIVALELSDFENSMKVSLIYLKRKYYPDYLRYFVDLITHSLTQ